MDCNMQALPVPHYLLEFSQHHVHWVCYLSISSSATLFSSCPQAFPVSGSSSHVKIRGLDHKEGWELKNQCFQVVVLEKTLKRPLNCKITPVKAKGNQPWIFIEGLMLKLQYFGHLMWRADSLSYIIISKLIWWSEWPSVLVSWLYPNINFSLWQEVVLQLGGRGHQS